MKKKAMKIPTLTVSKSPESSRPLLSCSEDEDNPANDYPDEEKDEASTSDPDWDLLGRSVVRVSALYIGLVLLLEDDSTCED
jgi:hypothetical protein